MPILTGPICFNINSLGTSKSFYLLNTIENAEDPAAVSEELTASLGKHGVYSREVAKVVSSSVPGWTGWMVYKGQRDLTSVKPLWFADVFEVIK